jgi:hypothetical protein
MPQSSIALPIHMPALSMRSILHRLEPSLEALESKIRMHHIRPSVFEIPLINRALITLCTRVWDPGLASCRILDVEDGHARGAGAGCGLESDEEWSSAVGGVTAFAAEGVEAVWEVDGEEF